VVRKLALSVAAWLVIAGGASAQTNRQQEVWAELRKIESLERTGRLAAARIALDSLLEEWPTEPRALILAERVYGRQGDLAAVLPVLERAIEVDPTAPLPRQVQLRVLVALDRIDEIRVAGESWLRATPRSDIAYREYALALRQLLSDAEAVNMLKRGLAAVDQPHPLAAELANLYLQQGRWSDAAAQWVDVTRASPRLGRDLVRYTLESLGPGAEPAARALLVHLSDEGTDEERELGAIAAIYAGRLDEALERADALIADLEGKDRRGFAARFSDVAANRNQPALVTWAYRQMLMDVIEDSTRWELARQVVEHDLSAGDTVTAHGLLRDVLARAEPGMAAHRWASALQIRVYAAGGSLDDAQAALADHASAYPDDPEISSLALTVGVASLRYGRLEEAARVLSLAPRSGMNRVERARLAAATGYLALYEGRYEEARAGIELAGAELSGWERSEALRVLVFLKNGNEVELRAVADAHRSALQGRPLDAYRRLRQALDGVAPSSARPALLLWAGELAMAGGAVAEAEQVLRRIPERYPRSGEAPVAMMTLAEELAVSGRLSEAIALLEDLILEYPESALTPIGRRRLAELKEEIPRS
jgi:tetratricopeptide (TPR) repeat protein